MGTTDGWGQHSQNYPQQRAARVGGLHRQPLGVTGPDCAFASGGYVSDRSDSANEVENLLVNGGHRSVRGSTSTGGWPTGFQAASSTQRIQPVQRGKCSFLLYVASYPILSVSFRASQCHKAKFGYF